MAFEIAKAGWLHRESSVLRRWKRNWFVLYQDGTFRYFDSPESHEAEEAVRMQPECLYIKTGHQVANVTPPVGMNQNCLLSMSFRDKTWNLCAESPDDMSAWQMALEDSRIIPGPAQPGPNHMPQRHPPRSNSAPPPYSATVYPQQHSATVYPQQNVTYAYPGQTVYGSNPPGYVMQVPQGQTTVIYADDPYYRRRRYNADGTDVAMGVMAGAALGSMMYMPLLWW